MSHTPKVISDVVNNDLCIGCGLCTYTCPSNALTMSWNDYGFLVPDATGECCSKGECLTACPFDPNPRDPSLNETGLANIFLSDTPSTDKQLGRYFDTYVGYAPDYRVTSSSGGIASYIFEQLLERGVVDHIVSVGEPTDNNSHYQYTVRSTKEEIRSTSKTKYYPVTLADILPVIEKLEGKVAITGVGCFVKAIRLAQNANPKLKDKIPFIVGIICGGVKSRFFTEYLASKAGAAPKHMTSPQYRIKDPQSTASDYSFGCTDAEGQKLIKMREVGDMWGTGMFKANACDFCDDVTTELADISLGDAWLEPYVQDGLGTSVFVTRSQLADELIRSGISNNELHVKPLPSSVFLDSQRGSFNHRHIGLPIRIKERLKSNLHTPPKRQNGSLFLPDTIAVQKLRQHVRQRSLETWKSHEQAKTFDKLMQKNISRLYWITRLTHYRRAVIRKIIGFIK